MEQEIGIAHLQTPEVLAKSPLRLIKVQYSPDIEKSASALSKANISKTDSADPEARLAENATRNKESISGVVAGLNAYQAVVLHTQEDLQKANTAEVRLAIYRASEARLKEINETIVEIRSEEDPKIRQVLYTKLDEIPDQLFPPSSESNDVPEKAREYVEISINSTEELNAVYLNLPSITHDVRTPQTSLRGRLQLLDRDLTSGKKTVDEAMEVNGQNLSGYLEAIQRYIQGNALIELENKYPVEELTVLDFLGEIDRRRVDLPSEVKMENLKMLIDEYSLRDLRRFAGEKRPDDPPFELDHRIMDEARDLLVQYAQATAQGEKELITDISFELMSQLQFKWALPMMEAVLMNILSNSQKSMLRKAEEAENQGQMAPEAILQPLVRLYFGNIQMIIQDNGIGAPQKVIDDGFKPGLSNWGESEIVSGTGIGMYEHLVQLRGDKYKGNLFLENKEIKVGVPEGTRAIAALPSVFPPSS